MSMITFMLIWDEHEKITSGPFSLLYIYYIQGADMWSLL